MVVLIHCLSATAICAMALTQCLAADLKTAAGQQQDWSLQPVCRAELPEVKNSDWPRREIDCFVLARLDAAGMVPVRGAGPRTLLRRLYFDLIGLPPSPEEIRAYLDDESANRFEKLVDRLLESPQFGERWGRHWLDVVRFAESSGKEFNFSYPHAWPYRDYVIDSLNADKPYDQFIREQLAGDLLHANRLPEQQNDELFIATGFLAIGPKRHNNGQQGFDADMVDELIDVTMRSVLGLTVACARCHDHKFDPISSHDYYALAGIFASTDPLYGTIAQKYSNHPTDLVAIGPHAQQKHAAAQEHDAKVKEATEKLSQEQEKLKQAQEQLKAPAENSQQQPATGDTNSTDVSASGEKETEVAAFKAQVAELEKAVEELKASAPSRPGYTVSARDQKKPVNAKIAIRGNPGDLGEEVPRGYLNCLRLESVPPPSAEQSGRLELAQWMTSRENPLTARVMVNRVWRHLFGAGLVRSVDDFGELGIPPSHPELLDWLASEFMSTDWSVKHMIRTIVLSRSYRLSSTADEQGMEVDPANVMLWRMSPRRLEAEAIRDALLAVSGQLDLSRPEGSPVTDLGDRLVRDVKLDQLRPPSNHRSVYLPVVRDYPPKLFELFDFPSPNLVSGVRDTTTGPLQDLYLRNDLEIQQHSRAMAELLLKKAAASDEARVQLAFELVFGRLPSAEEEAASLLLIEDLLNHIEGTELDKSEAANQQQEESDTNENTSPTVRAWGSLCQALFGSAEFRYLVDIDYRN